MVEHADHRRMKAVRWVGWIAIFYFRRGLQASLAFHADKSLHRVLTLSQKIIIINTIQKRLVQDQVIIPEHSYQSSGSLISIPLASTYMDILFDWCDCKNKELKLIELRDMKLKNSMKKFIAEAKLTIREKIDRDMSEPFSHKALLVKKISREIKQENTASKEGNLVEAIKHGQKGWDYLLHLMKIMEVDSIYKLEKADVTEYDLLFWAANFAEELYSAGLKDKSFEKQQLDFFESYVDMHHGMLDRYVRNLGNIRILLAECYFKMGKTEKPILYLKIG
jgi:hypothetical protein